MKMKRVEPKVIIEKFLENSGNISKTANDLNISRNTVRLWIKRSRSVHSYSKTYYKKSGLTRLSTKPKHLNRKLNSVQENRLIELAKKRKLDQIKLAYIYEKIYGVRISPKTVYNIIKRRDPTLINKKPKYIRPRFQNGSHMRPSNTKEPGYIQADVKYVTPELGGLFFTCYEFAFIDIYSRYKVAWIMPNLDQEASITAFRYMLKVMPPKVKYIQTDNGWEFGRKFHHECIENGADHYYIHKSSPNENAVIERSFRTDQDEFFYCLDKEPVDINELNLKYQQYLKFYNEERPHLSLNLQTPIEVLNSFNLL